jgi:hypothetical protein
MNTSRWRALRRSGLAVAGFAAVGIRPYWFSRRLLHTLAV